MKKSYYATNSYGAINTLTADQYQDWLLDAYNNDRFTIVDAHEDDTVKINVFSTKDRRTSMTLVMVKGA